MSLSQLLFLCSFSLFSLLPLSLPLSLLLLEVFWPPLIFFFLIKVIKAILPGLCCWWKEVTFKSFLVTKVHSQHVAWSGAEGASGGAETVFQKNSHPTLLYQKGAMSDIRLVTIIPAEQRITTGFTSLISVEACWEFGAGRNSGRCQQRYQKVS